MTYAAFESSDGRPVELYEFKQGGTFFRYTSASRDYVVGAVTYQSKTITRTEPTHSKDDISGDITLTVPRDFTIAILFQQILPAIIPSLTVYRLHLNDGGTPQIVAYWKGFLSSVAFRDNIATIACQPVTRVFNKQIPRFVYSGVCNHVLYDQGCQVANTSFKFQGIINAFVDSTTMEIIGLGAAAVSISPGLSTAEHDIYWQGGYIEMDNGERRTILEGNVSSNPDYARILLPFEDVQVGDQLTVFAGCNHSIHPLTGDCDRKFGNGLRYGGFAFVPTANPFNIELDGGV